MLLLEPDTILKLSFEKAPEPRAGKERHKHGRNQARKQRAMLRCGVEWGRDGNLPDAFDLSDAVVGDSGQRRDHL